VAEAFFWGALAQSTLVIGAVIAVVRPLSKRMLGIVMAFGAGVLLSALSFELISRAVSTADGLRGTTLGFFAGALVFSVGDAVIVRHESGPGEAEADAGLPIVLGALLDGIPESAVLGLTLLQDGRISVAMLVAVVISNLPEGIAATAALRSAGWSTTRIIELWSVVVVAAGLAAALGFALLDDASPYVLAFVLAFAAGAILTMLATSMMPQAYTNAGRTVGIATVAGFALALSVNWLQG
jgi:ZIP family zinc transporter